MYAKSGTQVCSLKANLMQNPISEQSLTEYMKDVWSLVDAFALVDLSLIHI